jgi:hypothetical protein
MNRPDYLEDSDVVSARFQVSVRFCQQAPPTVLPTHFIFDGFRLIFLFWCLQRRDVYGAWEQYLGLEHTDTAPKRAYTANQVCLLGSEFLQVRMTNLILVMLGCSYAVAILMLGNR